MKLQPHTEHPHGLTDSEYDTLFTKDKPIIFAYHGYPTLIHELTYRRHNKNLHVRGYKEEGTITTPFDMRVLNDIDRFDLVIDTVRRLPQLGNRGAYLVQKMNDKLVEHRQYIRTTASTCRRSGTGSGRANAERTPNMRRAAGSRPFCFFSAPLRGFLQISKVLIGKN